MCARPTLIIRFNFLFMFTGVCSFVNFPFFGFVKFSIGMFSIFLFLMSCKSFFYMEAVNPQFDTYVLQSPLHTQCFFFFKLFN